LAAIARNLVEQDSGTMKRAGAFLAAVAAGVFLVSAPVHASEELSATRILNKVYASLGMDDEMSDVEPARNGIFFGVHSTIGPYSGLMPAAGSLASPLFLDRGVEDSIAANGYYV